MYAGGWCVSVTDACLRRFFFFSIHKCFHNQSGNERANTHAALRAIMTWTERWHQSHSQKAVGESRSGWGRVQDFFFSFNLECLWSSNVTPCFKTLLICGDGKMRNDILSRESFVYCLPLVFPIPDCTVWTTGKHPWTGCHTITASTKTLLTMFIYIACAIRSPCGLHVFDLWKETAHKWEENVNSKQKEPRDKL